MKTESTFKKLDRALMPTRVGIVATFSWHQDVVNTMVESAHQCLLDHDLTKAAVFHVSGAQELAQAAMKLAQSGQYDAIVPIGCIVQGETDHHAYIANSVFSALQTVALQTRVAVSNGILTTKNLQQAQVRAKGKGYDATLAAIDLSQLLRTAL